MKKIFLILVLFTAITSKAQQAENIIIITTDGFRWQKLLKVWMKHWRGQKKFNQTDSAYIYKSIIDVSEREKN
jgi:hypothetical protein